LDRDFAGPRVGAGGPGPAKLATTPAILAARAAEGRFRAAVKVLVRIALFTKR
jgi:hypothetical protein